LTKKKELGAISVVKLPGRLSKGVALRSAAETDKLVQELISRFQSQGALRTVGTTSKLSLGLRRKRVAKLRTKSLQKAALPAKS